MQNQPNKKPRRNLRYITQISESHCGPAVLEMLLSAIGINADQRKIAEAAGVEKTIEEHGTRVDHLALATKVLAPQAKFWYKENSSFEDILKILNEYGYPLGVEWQGLFDVVDEEDGDYGHYSVISHVDEEKRQVTMLDPYKDFAQQKRIIPINTFMDRWWDTNEILDPKTKETKLVEDHHLLFIITPTKEKFPIKLGMKK